jgi:hypothetical protein
VNDVNVIKLKRKSGQQQQQHNNNTNNNMTLMGAIPAWGEPLHNFGYFMLIERGTSRLTTFKYEYSERIVKVKYYSRWYRHTNFRYVLQGHLLVESRTYDSNLRRVLLPLTPGSFQRGTRETLLTRNFLLTSCNLLTCTDIISSFLLLVFFSCGFPSYI